MKLYQVYTIFGKRVGVHWGMVGIVVLMWIAMFLFLPGGLLNK